MAQHAKAHAHPDAPATGDVLTPRRMIEAHQLDTVSVNPAGTHAIVGVRRFSFDKESFTKTLYLIDVPTLEQIQNQPSAPSSFEQKPSTLLSAKVSEAFWLSDEEVLYLDDQTLYVKRIDPSTHNGSHHHNVHLTSDLLKAMGIRVNEHGKHVGIFPTRPTSMRLAPKNKSDEATIVFSAEVYADGDLTKVKEHDESDEVKEWQDYRVYDSLMVRHWDRWIYPGKRSQLFAIDLKRHGHSWSFASPFRNLLSSTTLESPVKPFGGASDYDASQTHLVFTARDPSVQAAWHTKHNIYLVPLDGSKKPKVVQEGDHGACASPAFSPHGDHIVWLQMLKDGYEADKNRITLAHISTGKVTEILSDWPYSPGSVRFSRDGKGLVGTVEQEGQVRLFTIALHRSNEKVDEQTHSTTLSQHEVDFRTEAGVVESYHQTTAENSFVIAASTLQGPAEVYLVSPGASKATSRLKSPVIQLTAFAQAEGSPLAGLNLGPQPEHLHYPGAGGRDSYLWLLKPPGFDESEKAAFPLLVLVHGGPESAFTNSWSRRWNPATFAAQGFVVICINPAGSTGYGQDYTEEIIGQLGGAPFEDVIAGTKFILGQFDAIDASRLVAAGGSYGGYMMNWIQGHNDEGLFKGLVSHDSVFSMQGMYYATDELYFPEHEAGGPIFEPEVRKKFEKWSPEQYTHKWSTPMLIIHGGRDYRLTEGESLSCFNVLQRRQIESRLLYFPDENHWVIRPKNSLKWHQEVLGWLKKHSQAHANGQDSKTQQAGPGQMAHFTIQRTAL